MSINKSIDSAKELKKYYNDKIKELCRFLVAPKSRILEIGSGEGQLLSSVTPSYGLGIDINKKAISSAKNKYPSLKFRVQDAHKLSIKEKFDYIIISDVIGALEDIQKVFSNINKISSSETRIIITYYNFLWEPILKFAEKIGLKRPQSLQNWLSNNDIKNLLSLADLEIVREGSLLLIPIYIPYLSDFFNRYVARLPVFKNFCLVSYFVARKRPDTKLDKEYSVSVIVPARNEAGNIEDAVKRTPKMGKMTEIIFVEGGSKDNTQEEILRVIKKHKGKKLKLVKQGKGIGKGDAVRKGFAAAKGDILMILDADLTVIPEELPKFYEVIKSRKAEFVMGSRLVYQQEAQAMRFLNILGNKFFSLAFSWLLDQPIKDTLCGTKVLFRSNYLKIAAGRKYFGDFDPFGDYDLIFGAAKLNLKIVEIPIRYKARTYGSTNISRFKHGLLLLRMTTYAARKIKFI